MIALSALSVCIGFLATAPQAQGADKWETRTFTDISVEAPFTYGAGPDIMGKLPEQVKKLIALYQIFDSGDNTLPRSTVARVVYTEGTPVSLDGANQGAMKQAAGAIGDANPKFDTKEVTVSGLPGRRAIYHGKVGTEDVFIEGLVVVKGQQMWQVQALYTAASDAEKAKRILDSVKITPAK